jgi:opacity protein-like surface antigen
LFVKGFLGASAMSRGNLRDEDFPGEAAYSNTLSSAQGHFGYANIDTGYDFLRSHGAKLGAFLGYNYFSEHYNTFGCVQTAGDAVCANGAIPPRVIGIAEDDRFQSLRVGLSSQFVLTDRLKFTADAAYLPWVGMSGVDDHNARQLLGPVSSRGGNGVMLEASLDYRLTDHWSIGAGARYWAWNMPIGTTTFVFLGTPPTFNEPIRSNAERYGVFFETSYRWGETTPVTKAGEEPVDWTGVYIGGHLGGGFSDAKWSDPFGSTTVATMSGKFTNLAGFGDTTHAPGPLAGAQIGVNWQTGPWVIGAEANGDGANLRGENTCFSGLGGVNCQHIVNGGFDLAARGGYAFDRTLLFAKAGGAWTSTRYNLLANTGAIEFGSGGANQFSAGWLLGAGLEYKLNDRWSTSFEYNHIGLNAHVTFPTVEEVNRFNIGVQQSVDVFKLGLNYKL